MQTYIVYSPPETLEEGVKAGGPVCIKTGLSRAYVGFATPFLAKEFCEYWGIQNANIIPIAEFSASQGVDPAINTVVRFSDTAALTAYKSAPALFPFEQHRFKMPNLAFERDA